jgi:hypothetical protein
MLSIAGICDGTQVALLERMNWGELGALTENLSMRLDISQSAIVVLDGANAASGAAKD